MQDHLLPFLPKGVEYELVFLPPLCVPLCICFFISVVKTWGKVEMYPGLSVFIEGKAFFFFLPLNVTIGKKKKTNHCPPTTTSLFCFVSNAVQGDGRDSI